MYSLIQVEKRGIRQFVFLKNVNIVMFVKTSDLVSALTKA